MTRVLCYQCGGEGWLDVDDLCLACRGAGTTTAADYVAEVDRCTAAGVITADRRATLLGRLEVPA